MHLTYEDGESTGVLGIERTDHSFLYHQSQSQILNACPSPLEDSDQMSRQPLNKNSSGLSNPSIHRLNAANLRYSTKDTSATDKMGDCSLTYAITENQSTIVADGAVSESGRVAWCDPELGAMDLEEESFQQRDLILWPMEYQCNDESADSKYSAEILDEDLLWP